MEKLTTRQRQVLNFIRRSLQKNGIAPTRAEIADAMGFQSKNAAVDHLKALERKGVIRLHSDLSRGIQLLDGSEVASDEVDLAILSLPIIGSVAAGSPIEAIENVEQRVTVPDNLFRQQPTYLLRVRGDSMKDAGILDGDLIAVRKTSEAQSGQIVVARIHDEVTVKTLLIKRNRPVLMPANDAYRPIIMAPEDLTIEGVFVGLIRDAG
ncbi:MAG: transcriptional repressor LexA [Pseudomonadota bacterium]